MSGVLLPLAVTAAAGTATYWFCVRPMRRGTGSISADNADNAEAATQASTIEQQLAEARAEVERLRAAAIAKSGIAAGTGPSPDMAQERAGARSEVEQLGAQAAPRTGTDTAALAPGIEQQLAAARAEVAQLRAATGSRPGPDA